MPKTKLGKWSVWLIIVFFVSMAILLILGLSGAFQGGDTFSINLGNPIEILFLLSLVLAGTCGIASFVTGLISIIKFKERSVLVFVTSAIGLYVLVMFVGELLSVVGILPSH